MIRVPSLRAATLCAVLSVCFGCSSPDRVPAHDLVRAPQGPAAGTFEVTVTHGVVLPASDAAGVGVVHVPLYHESISPVLPSPWINGTYGDAHVFMITGEEQNQPWVLAGAEPPVRLVTSQAVLQPILGKGLYLAVRANAEGMWVVAIDEDGAELGNGFQMPQGAYLWLGQRTGWNDGEVAGTLITLRPTSTPPPSR